MSLATFSRILGKALGSPISPFQSGNMLNAYYADYSVHVSYSLNTESWQVVTPTHSESRYTLDCLLVFLTGVL